MSWLTFALVVTAWGMVSLVVSLVMARMVRLRDQQRPMSGRTTAGSAGGSGDTPDDTDGG